MSIFFISDLHLEQNKPHLTKAFENFINSKVNSHDELFILGDFFLKFSTENLTIKKCQLRILMNRQLQC